MFFLGWFHGFSHQKWQVSVPVSTLLELNKALKNWAKNMDCPFQLVEISPNLSEMTFPDPGDLVAPRRNSPIPSHEIQVDRI